MHIIAVLAVIIIIVFFTYEGYRNGLYESTYLLFNHIVGFLLAMTFAGTLANFIQSIVPTFQTYPGPEYLFVISFAVLFAVTRGIGSFLRQRFITGEIFALDLLDRIGGGVLGLADGIVISGFTLILLALLPFMPYIPGDYGRVKVENLPVDTGSIMLSFYANSADRMGGSRPFLLHGEPMLQDDDMDGFPDAGPGEGFEDLNENGEWDRGWMWRYKHHADFTVEEVVKTTGKTEAEGEETETTEEEDSSPSTSEDEGFPEKDVEW